MNGKKEEYFLAGFLLVLLGLYSWYALIVHPPWLYLYSDMAGYIERAKAYAAGQTPTAYFSLYPAGTTYFFALFFKLFPATPSAYQAIAIFQALLLTGTCFIVHIFTKLITKNGPAAWLTLLLTASYYPLISYLGFYLSELLFCFLLVLGLYLFYRTFLAFEKNLPASLPFMALLVGIILGLAADVRSSIYPTIAILLIVLILISRKEPRRPPYSLAVICTLGIIAAFSLQTSYVSLALGRPAFFPTNGALSTYIGQGRFLSVSNNWDHNYYSTFYDNNSYYDKGLKKEAVLDFPTWESSSFNRLSLKLWRENPLRQLKISISNVGDLFRPIPNWPARNEDGTVRPLRLFQLFFVTIVDPLAFWGLVTARQKNRGAIFVLGSALVGISIMAFLSKGEERYLAPYYPILFILAGMGWLAIKNSRLFPLGNRRRGFAKEPASC